MKEQIKAIAKIHYRHLLYYTEVDDGVQLIFTTKRCAASFCVDMLLLDRQQPDIGTLVFIDNVVFLRGIYASK